MIYRGHPLGLGGQELGGWRVAHVPPGSRPVVSSTLPGATAIGCWSSVDGTHGKEKAMGLCGSVA